MRHWIIAGFAAASVCGYASATLHDNEPNNSLATASVNGPLHGADAGAGLLDTNDVDFYSFQLDAGTLFTASIFDFTPGDPFDHDSLLGLFASDGSLIMVDDDGGPGYLSSLAAVITQTATYYLGVTGYGDDLFTGAHGENFSYKLVVNSSVLVPGPSALASLATAMIIRGRRRRA